MQTFSKVAGLALLLASASTSAATFIVTNIASSGAGSLAQAITSANAAAGADTINFSIAGGGVKVIELAGALPSITEALTINGYSQPGSAPNTTASGASNAVILIELDAGNVASSLAAIFATAPLTLRGIAIRDHISGATAIRITSTAAGSTIAGCFIGTNAAGNSDGSTAGTGLNAAGQTQIGGTLPADRNLFAGNQLGITVGAAGSGSIIEGNLFGVGANGTLSLPNGRAIRLNSETVSDVRIGGTVAGSGNLIANSQFFGISLLENAVPGSGNSILGNSMFNNGTLGIDLGADDEPDVNDSGDADTGVNGRENAPALSFARDNGSTVMIYGSLDGNFTGGAKRVEYFASPTASPSGFGEGRFFLGSATINPTGIAIAFLRNSISAANAPAPPYFVTATSTAADGSTSEFSNALLVVDGGTERTVTNVADSGAGSLRQAILDANGAAGVDTIRFNIAGNGPHTITPATALPAISGSTIVDGYSELLSSENSLLVGTDADLRIVIDGSSAGASSCLLLSGGSSVVRGLVVHSCGNLGINSSGGSGHVIEGNFVGTDVTGTLDRGSLLSGVNVATGVSGVRVGGTLRAQRNLISGNGGAGIASSGIDTNIIGNLVGTAANGTTALANTFTGIGLNGTGSMVVGNRVRSNGGTGIGITGASVQVELRVNETFGNGGLGIDLNADGITPNDLNDIDVGPNGLQNFPVLTRVEQLQNGGLRVEGTLDLPVSAVALSFELDLFRSGSCDGTHGEGETAVLSRTISFANGTVETFAFTAADISVPTASVMTATVTSAAGNTSEFSACVTSSVQTTMIFANGFE
ncbi:MAG: beta strand repeat-containing protein [Pseudomarimonas sp.]